MTAEVNVDDIERARYANMRWNTPLSEEHAGLILARLGVEADCSILDLGCGWGELLLRTVSLAEGTTGTGVDNDPEALERGRRLAEDRGNGGTPGAG